MYDVLSLSLLENANLSADWMTLYVGVRGIERDGFGTAHLPFAEVRAFALDRLAEVVGTLDEWNVYRIADADPMEPTETFWKVLRELAESTGISDNVARRKWRYAMIYHISQQIAALEEPGNSLYRTDWDAWYETSGDLHNLRNAWSDVYVETPPPPQVFDVRSAGDEVKRQQTITAYNEWREREYAAIIAASERGAIQ